MSDNRLLKILFILCLLVPYRNYAQIDLGIGPQLDFPLMYNNEVGSYHHSLGAPGPKLVISYISPNTSFYPSLSVNACQILLPLMKVGGTAVNIRFTEANITLSAKLRKQLNKGELHYGLGLSGIYLDGQDIQLSGDKTNVLNVITDSNVITMWTPAVNLNVEYIIPISTSKPWFAGIGFNLHYIHFFDRGINYNVQIQDASYNYTKYTAKLQGDVFTPGFYIAFYYRFGHRDQP